MPTTIDLTPLCSPTNEEIIKPWLDRQLHEPFNWTGLTVLELIDADRILPAMAADRLYTSVTSMTAQEMLSEFGVVPGLNMHGDLIDDDRLAGFYQTLHTLIVTRFHDLDLLPQPRTT